MPEYEDRIRLLEDIRNEVEKGRVEEKEARPRILLTGVPTGIGSHKVVRIIEECGGAVVVIDNCSCYKKVRRYPEVTGDALDMLARYSLGAPCAVMTPNPGRFEAVERLAADFLVDAVCDLAWQGCQTYEVESYSLRQYVQDSLHLPFLQIVSDYADSDCEQLRIRIEAFIEMLL